MVNKFEDLNVWKLARELNNDVYELIVNNSSIKDWPLKDQLNRSCASIMDNIAEGFGRNGKREYIQFLSCSKASCCEVKSQLYRATDRNYLDRSNFEKTFDKADHVEKMLAKLISHNLSIDSKGWKFEKRVDE